MAVGFRRSEIASTPGNREHRSMKREQRAILASMAFGMMLWILDAILRYYFFRQAVADATFGGLLLTDIPYHVLYSRSVLVLFCLIFGMLVSVAVGRQRRAEEHLREALGSLEIQVGKRTIELRAANDELKQHRDHLEDLVNKRAADLAESNEQLRLEIVDRERAEEEVRRSYEDLRALLTNTVDALASAVETRDPYTAGHQRRVSDLAAAIASEMGMSDEAVKGIFITGVIHDIGKIRVPAEILSRPGQLDEIEFNLIKSHATVGYNLLKDIDFPWPVAEIVYQHHERMDGSGYPRGLSGKDILAQARILAVADVVPNAKMTGDNIINYSAKDSRRVDMVMGVGYGDNLDKVKQTIDDVLGSDERILKDPAPTVGVLELGDSSVNFAVRPWVATADYWDVFFDTQKKLKERFDAEGISIPFPQRDVHLIKDEA